MLRLEGVTLSIGNHEVLADANLHVHPGDKCGITGPNGAGKTSLLRVFLRELEAERGAVIVRAGAAVGWLPQAAVSGSQLPVWEEVQTQMTRHRALKAAVDRAQADLERGQAGAVERLDDATEAWRLAGGFALDERVGEVLHGLGFRQEHWQRTCDTFSGGWQMRIALARLLLADPDILLLDEPTNHLDLPARSWLARFLAQLNRTVVVVSHDRWLLDKVCTRTVEVRQGKVTSFRGNLTAWLAEKEARLLDLVAQRKSQEQQLEKLESFVERFGAKATKASQAQSRRKAIERIELVDLPEHEHRPRLSLPEAPGSSQEMLELRGATFGHPNGPDVLVGVDLLLLRGQRLAVLGPNGSGKSTLLGGLAGELTPRAGRRRLGKDVRIGVYHQDLAARLPLDSTPLDVVSAAAPLVQPARIRAALGALGLRGDAALRPIRGLSGGEKARVVLAQFAVTSYNLLLLDEPTNHLDAVTVETVCEALQDFGGAVVVVTHDRFLVERVATHIARVEGDRLQVYEGVRPELLEPPSARSERGDGQVGASAGAVDHEARRRAQKERQRLSRQLDQKMAEAEKIELRQAAIDAAVVEAGADWARAAKLASERAELDRKMDGLFEEMAALEGQIGALGAP